MRIGIVNGAEKLKLNIKDVHIELIESYTSEKFDILIFNKPTDFIWENFLKVQDKSALMLVNSDEYDSFSEFKNFLLITYGLNNKSCITVSSIQQNKIQLCIQRNLCALNGKIVEEQEFIIEIENAEQFLDEIMFLSAANILIFGDTKNLSRWF